jgi:hypothetical protein
LIIRLIIQTIRLDPSGFVWIDEASNMSRPDPSGADQIDAEHQATDLKVGGSNPSRRANVQLSDGIVRRAAALDSGLIIPDVMRVVTDAWRADEPISADLRYWRGRGASDPARADR